MYVHVCIYIYIYIPGSWELSDSGFTRDREFLSRPATFIPTLDIQCQVGPQQIITTTTTHGCGGHKAAAWRELLLKVKKKIARYINTGTGAVPFALRSGGQCALESPMSWLRVARTCPQSAARTTGRAIQCVVDRPIRFREFLAMTWQSCTA